LRVSDPVPAALNTPFNCRAIYDWFLSESYFPPCMTSLNSSLDPELGLKLEDYRVIIELWSQNSLGADKLVGATCFNCAEIRDSPFAQFEH
jgi:hypothetical protein